MPLEAGGTVLPVIEGSGLDFPQFLGQDPDQDLVLGQRFLPVA